MSNQPKITYRSDSTGRTYQMMQQNGCFTVQAVDFDGVIRDESLRYTYLYPWRNTINAFFDVVTMHINDGKWRVR